jgi:SCP-2 sterol transfer family
VRYLSPEWFAAAQAAVENDTQLRELTAELDLTVEQIVDGGPEESGPSSRPEPGGNGDTTTRWHLVFDHGSVRLVVGRAERADLRFRAPYSVATAIARGELAAGQAFIRGDLTVGGDLRLLTAHQRVFAAVGDVLKETR